MPMLLKSLWLCLLLLPLGLHAQHAPAHAVVRQIVSIDAHEEDTNIIAYNPAIPLTINNFLGTPNEDEMNAATTYSGFGMEYTAKGNEYELTINITIKVSFDKQKSWCKVEHRNANILSHEQLHWDITALHACLFLQAIKATNLSSANYAKELDALMNKYQTANNLMQMQYDTETNHSINKTQQQQWQAKIHELLQAQSCYTKN